MIRRPPQPTRAGTRISYTTLFRSSQRHRRDRQRQLAVQEPKLSAVAAVAGAGANEDVVLVDVERVVPFYVPIPVPVPAPIDTLSGIWGYRLFWGQAKNTPKSTPNSNRRGWSQRVATGRAHAQQDAKNICNLLGKYSPVAQTEIGRASCREIEWQY